MGALSRPVMVRSGREEAECHVSYVLGTQSVEYKNKVWHEDCFKCFECKQPIRTKSFLTKGDDIYCTSCHDTKFSKKCFHCKKVGDLPRSYFTWPVWAQSVL